MKLQISFDLTDLDKALEIALGVAPYASMIEVGSLLLYKYGVKALEKFRATFEDKTIIADAKIIDRGKESVNLLSHAGADWITIMSGTHSGVIHSACNTAHDLNKKIMLDLMDSASPGQSALEAKSFGGDALLFHEEYDKSQAPVFMDKWEMVRGNTPLPIYVTGRVNRDTIDTIINLKPDGVIIGRAIVDAQNPIDEARFFYEKISQSS
jgi:3-hexulose-6-phosphate synthase